MQVIVSILVLVYVVSATPRYSRPDSNLPLYAISPNEQATELAIRFGTSFISDYKQLPKTGRVQTPWSSSYWPTYMDSINIDWQQMNTSPAGKYAKALGLNVRQIEDAVSRSDGVEAYSGGTVCNGFSDCKVGDMCAIRRGKTSGYCIPLWFGLCHGWASAATLEPEPMCPVTYNGVRFEVNDVKALLIYLYGNVGIDAVYAGQRCDRLTVDLDEHGRPIPQECLDMNAGTFHMIVTNLIGRAKKGFVGEISLGSEVWNHPIASYELSDPIVVSPSHAMRHFFQGEHYVLNPHAKEVVYYRMTMKYTTESEAMDNRSFNRTGTLDQYLKDAMYEYILEIDEQGKILGGEFVNESKVNHFDFIWMAKRPMEYQSSASSIEYSVVKSLLERSVQGRC